MMDTCFADSKVVLVPSRGAYIEIREICRGEPEERYVTDPETGATGVAFQGDRDSARNAKAWLSQYRDSLHLVGKWTPPPRVAGWLGDAMDCMWHSSVLDGVRAAYDRPYDDVVEFLGDLVFDRDAYPVAVGCEIGSDDDRRRFDYLFRSCFAGAVPEWKAREVVLVELLRHKAAKFAARLRELPFGDDMEADAICDAIIFADGLSQGFAGYCRNMGNTISQVGSHVFETGCMPHEATASAGIDWDRAGWDGWDGVTPPKRASRW